MLGEAILLICFNAYEWAGVTGKASIPHVEENLALLNINSRFKFTYNREMGFANVRSEEILM